jgi:hypothetical protein
MRNNPFLPNCHAGWESFRERRAVDGRAVTKAIGYLRQGESYFTRFGCAVVLAHGHGYMFALSAPSSRHQEGSGYASCGNPSGA